MVLRNKSGGRTLAEQDLSLPELGDDLLGSEYSLDQQNRPPFLNSSLTSQLDSFSGGRSRYSDRLLAHLVEQAKEESRVSEEGLEHFAQHHPRVHNYRRLFRQPEDFAQVGLFAESVGEEN